MTTGPDYRPSAEALQGALGPLGAADLLLLAAQALRVGSLDYAAAICESYVGEAEPALRLTHAAALFGLGEQARAITLVDQVLAQQPAHLAARFYRAQMAQHAGDAAYASELLLGVLERFPDFPGRKERWPACACRGLRTATFCGVCTSWCARAATSRLA